MSESAVLTVVEAGRLLGISRNTAYRWARCGDLPVIRIGHSLRVPRHQLDRLLGQDDSEAAEVNGYDTHASARFTTDRSRKLTPNQLVAWNLERARRMRGWTQQEAAERLEPYLGERWSKATFSAAERSVDGSRIRQFTADDLFAFSRGFDVPINYFLRPPEWVEEIGHANSSEATPVSDYIVSALLLRAAEES